MWSPELDRIDSNALSDECPDATVPGRSDELPSESGRSRDLVRLALPCAAIVFLTSITYFAMNDVRVPKRGDIDAVLGALGGGDARWYVEGGLAIRSDELFSAQNRWMVTLWPPGMFVYYAVLSKIAASGIALAVIVAGVMSVLWTAALTLWFVEIRRRWNTLGAAVAIAVVLLSDVYRWWIFGEGLFYSEGLTGALFLLATWATVVGARSHGRRGLALAALAGVLLGATAYVRVVFELMGLVLTGCALVIAIVVLAMRLVHRRLDSVVRALILLAAVVGAFHVVTIPWRLVAEANVRPGNYAWSAAGDLYWHHQWTPDGYLEQQGWYWLAEGEVNTACEIEASRCNQVLDEELASGSPYSGYGRYTEADFKAMTFETIRDHPVEWVVRKAVLMPRFWFDRPDGAWGPSGLVMAMVSALSVVVVSALALWRLRKADLVALWWTSAVLGSLGPLLVMQFEARYFYILAISAPLLLAWLIGPTVVHWRRIGSRRPGSEQPPEAPLGV